MDLSVILNHKRPTDVVGMYKSVFEEVQLFDMVNDATHLRWNWRMVGLAESVFHAGVPRWLARRSVEEVTFRRHFVPKNINV